MYYRHKYPQNIWARQINRELKSLLLDVPEIAEITDAPCGNGIIASLVKKIYQERKVNAIDLNPDLYQSPFFHANANNPSFLVADIYEELTAGADNIWLFINSMYCLSDNQKLISKHRSSFKYIIAIFPDIQQDNYRYFLKHHPEFNNPSAMSLQDSVVFMHKNGYDLIKRIGNTKIKFHIWNHKYKFNLLPNKIRNVVLTSLDTILFLKQPQYSLMIFKRQ